MRLLGRFAESGVGEGIRYAALGASDAAGYGASSSRSAYPVRIYRELNRRGIPVTLANLGIPLLTTRGVLGIQVPAARLFRPNLITVVTGGNDILLGVSIAAFESSLSRLLDGLTALDSMVLVGTYPDVSATYPRYRRRRMERVNRTLIRLAAERAVPVCDFRGTERLPGIVAEDGLHPSDRGHDLIARRFIEEMDRLMPQLSRGTRPAGTEPWTAGAAPVPPVPGNARPAPEAAGPVTERSARRTGFEAEIRDLIARPRGSLGDRPRHRPN